MGLTYNIRSTVIKRHKGSISFYGNPMTDLIQQELVVRVGNGIFVLNGVLVDLLESIDLTIKKKIKEAFKADSVWTPSILSQENTLRSQYLDSFSNQAIVLSTIKDLNSKKPHTHLGMASPTICYHYFSSINHKKIKSNTIVTALGKCSRWEEGELNDLSRLTNFTMREAVFIGNEEYCLNLREKLMLFTQYLFDEIYDLDYQIVVAADPFFGQNSEIKKKAQLLSEAKFEIQATLPFNQSNVSVSSYNFHGKVFFDRFNISSNDKNINFSGCVGWGYERILFAILAQKGLDFSSDYYQKILHNL